MRRAAQAILPAGWSVATTRELPGTPAIAQHVGIAWRRGVRVRDVAPVNALADGGVPGRPLRPGLAFTVDVGGRPVRALVVHLKAGCRSRDLDAPLTRRREAARTSGRTRSRPTARCCATSCRRSKRGSTRNAHARLRGARRLQPHAAARAGRRFGIVPDAARRQRRAGSRSGPARWRAPASAGPPSARARDARDVSRS